MKRVLWLLWCGWFIAALGTAVMASRPDFERANLPGATMNRNNPYGCSGRPLLPHEVVGVQRACDSIASRGLTFIYHDADARPCTLYPSVIALVLREQLRTGRMKAETLATQGRRGRGFVARTQPDSLSSPWGDLVNISADLLNEWSMIPDKWKYLEEVLIHEYIHKIQDHLTCRNIRHAEADAWRATMAWKDTMHWNPNDQHYRDCRHTMLVWESRYQNESDYVRFWNPRGAGSKLYALVRGPAATGQDTLVSFDYGDTTRSAYTLGATRGSDLIVLENHPWLGPGHHLAMVFGSVPALQRARIVCFDVFDGGIVGPVDTLDFGPPLYPPMSFHAAVQSDDPGVYHVLDTLNHRVMNLLDSNMDGIPDLIFGVFADALWPGYATLHEVRGIAPTEHPVLGAGLAFNSEDVDFPDFVYPHSHVCFLPDANGDFTADALVVLPAYEFMSFMPAILEPPQAGDNTVPLYGTWQHTIAVYRTDSLGETLYELAGSALMSPGISAICPVSVPLVGGQYVLPVDMQNGERPARPMQVLEPVTTEENGTSILPEAVYLYPSWPNPFNAATTISFDLPSAAHVSLRAFDVLGREVALLKEGLVEAGRHSIVLDAGDLSSGIYFVRLETAGKCQTRKIALLR